MARLSTTERLGKRGIVHIEVGGVLARLTKAQSVDPGAYTRAIEAVSVATPLALQMRRRVRDEQRTAQGPWSGYSRASRVVLTEQYASAAGLAKRYYPHSAAMHANLRNGGKLFSVTGKMWEALQVRGSGRDRAVVDFAGSSLGRGTVVKKRRGKNGVRLVAVPATVRNAQKAGAILRHRDINVVEPTDTELEACAALVIERGVNGVQVTWGETPTQSRVSGGVQKMAEQIRARLAQKG